MKLIDMNKETIEKIIAICPNVNFTVHFIDVDSESLLTGLNDESTHVFDCGQIATQLRCNCVAVTRNYDKKNHSC